MNKKFILSLLLLTVVTFIGCETTRGVGKDVENTGENIQKTVDKNT